jgi:hypothetical protein
LRVGADGVADLAALRAAVGTSDSCFSGLGRGAGTSVVARSREAIGGGSVPATGSHKNLPAVRCLSDDCVFTLLDSVPNPKDIYKHLNQVQAPTLAEAARILGCSRPTVDTRIADGALETIPGSSPARVSLDSLGRELERLISEEQQKLERLHQAAAELGVLGGEQKRSTADPLSQRILELAQQLQQERVGRAAAEVRIDQLKADLRRANAAIDALKPDPDADF